jgi:hypothetical protein
MFWRRLMAKIAFPLTITLALMLLGCGSSVGDLPVRAEYSTTVSFQEWKTFRFSTNTTSADDGSQYPKYEKMVQQALLDELTTRGYTRIEDGSPDFRVAFGLRFRGDKTPKMTPDGGHADPTARSFAGPTPSGTLTVKMLDPLTSQVLWSGTISEIKMTAIEPKKELRKAVWRVLVEFPPITG